MESDISAIWADALLIVYLACTAVLLLVGRDRVSAAAIALHLAVLCAIATVAFAPVVPRWLRRWAPLLALLFLYTELPVLLRAAGQVHLFDAVIMRWEQALFGTQPAAAWAQAWPSRVFSETLHGAYLSYYGIIVVIPALLYRSGRLRDFDEAVFVLMLTFVACFTWYLFFPVAGPRYFSQARIASGGIVRGTVLMILEARSSRGTAFPSSHVAVATTQSVLAVRYFGRRGLLLAGLTVGLAGGAVYGGFHYAIDALVGAALGLAIALGALRVMRTR
ncbi:MAG TPA: phosphatase PAP2 family protein [Gemmatimonadaceae bacterium]|nr:phosphatase PAP2 family protein [Gemmatimonadaceae bacterium]